MLSLLFELLLLLDLLFPLELIPVSTDRPTSEPTAPRANKSAWRVPANANGAAHIAVIAENLIVKY